MDKFALDKLKNAVDDAYVGGRLPAPARRWQTLKTEEVGTDDACG